MITGDQIKAARQLLGWSTATLAIKSRRSIKGVAQAETSKLPAQTAEASLRLIQQTFEAEGIEFIPENGGSVRLRKP